MIDSKSKISLDKNEFFVYDIPIKTMKVIEMFLRYLLGASMVHITFQYVLIELAHVPVFSSDWLILSGIVVIGANTLMRFDHD